MAPPSFGRHAKPPGEAELALENVLRSVGSRRLIAAAGLLAGMALVIVLAVATMSGGSAKNAAHRRVTASQAAQRSTPSPSVQPLLGKGSTDSEPAALTYFQGKDGGIAGHVKDVRWSGDFLRVYTDYPENADNSKPALELCQWTWDYLSSQGAPGPVFVQGTSHGNGAVVLAKKLDGSDSCRVATRR